MTNKDVSERTQAEEALQQANEDLSQRLEELSALSRIAQTVATITDLSTVLQTVSDIIIRIFDARGAVIALLNEARTELKISAHVEREPVTPTLEGVVTPLVDEVASQLIEAKETVILTDIQSHPKTKPFHNALRKRGVHCLLNVPLLVRDQAIGVIALSTDQPERVFTLAEVRLAETVAGHVAGAIEVARLFEQERQQRQIAESLRQVTEILNASLDVTTVLAKIFEQVSYVIKCSGGGLFLEEDNNLVLAAGAGAAAEAHLGLRLSLESQNPAVWVFHQKHWKIVKDGLQEEHWLDWPENDTIYSWIGAPLFIGQEVIGVLTVDSYEPYLYTNTEAKILQVFADHAAVAIHNARLHEQAQRDAETKAALLQEVNHRVKNSLTGVIGMLYATQHFVGSAESDCAGLLDEVIHRVKGLVTVHQMLSASEWFPLRLDELTNRVIRSAIEILPADKFIITDVSDPDSVRVTPKQAHHLALIINELTTNSVKYALQKQHTARLTVRIGQENETVVFTFRDDGPGFRDEVLRRVNAGENERVGLYLVQSLVIEGLRGEVTFDSDRSAVVVIRFPADPVVETR